MRILSFAIVAIIAVTAAAPSTARAESIGLGLFIGRPTGLDIKIDLARRSAIDILLGVTSFEGGRATYGHVTYLVTPFVGRGRSILVPLRLGVGAAVYGVEDNVDFAVRAPLEIGLRFRRTPLEIYGELALAFQLSGGADLYGQGGIGLRVYF